MKNPSKNYKLNIVLTGIIILGIAILAYQSFVRRNNFEARNTPTATPQASISPEASSQKQTPTPVPASVGKCDSNQRAIGVMLATDGPTRPLSGISEADMVFEMPVITDSITRLMAVYRCTFPKEIGSIRSARHDYIDLALGIDAIFAHWGGSHFALDKLKTGIIDDLDALRNPYSVFYRKSGIRAPHNGFTSGDRLLNASQKLGYRMENKFEGYPRESAEEIKPKSENSGMKLAVGFPGQFRVEYQYDAASNTYLRSRGGKAEIDRNTNKQATANNIAVMYAEIHQIEGQYNDANLISQGKAEIYRDGDKIEGTWKKSSEAGKLYFLDGSGSEIKFSPGNIWVEILQMNQKTSWGR